MKENLNIYDVFNKSLRSGLILLVIFAVIFVVLWTLKNYTIITINENKLFISSGLFTAVAVVIWVAINKFLI